MDYFASLELSGFLDKENTGILTSRNQHRSGRFEENLGTGSYYMVASLSLVSPV